MKCIDAIIKPFKLEDVKEGLLQLGVKAMTLSRITDCGTYDGRLRIYRGSSYVINSAPMIRVQITVDEDMVDSVVDAIMATADPGKTDGGSISISPAAETVPIRVAERPSPEIGDRHHDQAKVA